MFQALQNRLAPLGVNVFKPEIVPDRTATNQGTTPTTLELNLT